MCMRVSSKPVMETPEVSVGTRDTPGVLSGSTKCSSLGAWGDSSDIQQQVAWLDRQSRMNNVQLHAPLTCSRQQLMAQCWFVVSPYQRSARGQGCFAAHEDTQPKLQAFASPASGQTHQPCDVSRQLELLVALHSSGR